MSEIRVRFAPSPTGGLHIGGVRTALYNYLFAKHHNGSFILRIEDTDRNRFVEGAEQYILESLKWLGLQPDEGPDIGGDHAPYRQSERSQIYQQYADELVKKGLAYYAFDTAEELEAMRTHLKETGSSNQQYNFQTRGEMRNSLTLSDEEVNELIGKDTPYVIRIKMPANETIVLNDLIRGKIEVSTNTLDDKILMKSDGLPTYHLANVVDDHLMQVTHVIRGEEWLPSAPLHVQLYHALGWANDMPAFAHMPLLLKPEGKGKLSKRDAEKGGFPIFPLNWEDPQSGATSTGYRETGFLPEALNNFLALLGWHPGTDDEIFSLGKMTELFTLERVGKAGIHFDINKARWFNQEYIRRKDDKELAEYVIGEAKKEGIEVSSEDAIKVAAMMKERVTYPQELFTSARYLFVDPKHYDEKVVRKKWNPDVEKVLAAYRNRLDGVDTLTTESAKAILTEVLENLGIGMGKVMQAIRVAITGEAGGPDLMGIIAFLGTKRVIRRIDQALEKLSA